MGFTAESGVGSCSHGIRRALDQGAVEFKATSTRAAFRRRPQIAARLSEQAPTRSIGRRSANSTSWPSNRRMSSRIWPETSGLQIQHVTGVTQDEDRRLRSASLRTGAFADDVVARGLNSRVIELDKSAYVSA